ncbi:glycosyltransferase [Curtobacterium sp. ISL-83]|uniref:glycosyltransferase family 2 protein n=1 Tax=Curtobacterium sp. ISL-83 TaxID=2819145 RepID=UPI001BEB9814|nr:glycosyltransferase [Curtobacterium sp. ISL-83]MBT2502714.1 glycosyltransferase [Curtobacterium sp. ISL-83]
MPRITVVMPAHNAGSTLQAAVRSTLRALPRDSEILVYDDASSDDTAEVANRLARDDRRVRLLGGDGLNVGAAAARNILIGATDSEFVAAMDADDVTLPNRFFAYEERMDGVDLLFAPIIRFGRGRRPHVPRPAQLSTDAVPLALFILNPLPQSTMIARRDALNGAGTYVHGPAEDYELWVRLAADGARIRFSSWPTVAYRHHEGQATARVGYERQVRENRALLRSWDRLGMSLGIPRASNSSNEELRSRATQLLDELQRPTDRQRVERLLNMPWAFPLASGN